MADYEYPGFPPNMPNGFPENCLANEPEGTILIEKEGLFPGHNGPVGGIKVGAVGDYVDISQYDYYTCSGFYDAQMEYNHGLHYVENYYPGHPWYAVYAWWWETYWIWEFATCPEQGVEPEVPFTDKEYGYTYSDIVLVNTSEYYKLINSCDALKGKIETSLKYEYDLCVYKARCKSRVNFIYDDETDSFIEILPGEPEYIPPELCDGKTITYTLKYNGNYTRKDCNNSSKTFYISYAGSTLTNGIDFNGPTSVTFTESGSKDFNIVILDYAETMSGQIILNISDPDGECPNYIEVFNIEKCDPLPPEIPNNYYDCYTKGFFRDPEDEDNIQYITKLPSYMKEIRL